MFDSTIQPASSILNYKLSSNCIKLKTASRLVIQKSYKFER